MVEVLKTITKYGKHFRRKNTIASNDVEEEIETWKEKMVTDSIGMVLN